MFVNIRNLVIDNLIDSPLQVSYKCMISTEPVFPNDRPFRFFISKLNKNILIVNLKGQDKVCLSHFLR